MDARCRRCEKSFDNYEPGNAGVCDPCFENLVETEGWLLDEVFAAYPEFEELNYDVDEEPYDGPCYHCSRLYSQPAGCLHCEDRHVIRSGN